MSGLATIERAPGRAHARFGSRTGSALVGTLVVVVCFLGLLYAASTLSAVEVRESRRAIDDLRTKHLAEAGAERAMNFLAQALQNGNAQDPLQGVVGLFGGQATISPFVGEPVLDGAAQVGSFSVTLTNVDQTASTITVAIDSTGYLPDAPGALAPGQQLTSWHAIRSTVRFGMGPSEVFDYAYFINNWGWFYGSSIFCNGNARSNGQFDVANYAPTITGQPLYDSVSWDGVLAKLSGYRDDNGDGLLDGNDGGVFSGWDIVGVQNLKGNGGKPSNQHDFQPPIEMPNLSDLTWYENRAVAEGGKITIDGTVVSDAIYGDGGGEKQNLYLHGTLTKPIVLDGPVVVRGDVIIKGYVTGKGAIYAGGNVYCPDSVKYVNAPTTPRPVNNTQVATEAWLTANWNQDFLGLFARENIVVGDFTNSTWRNYVGKWMADPLNESKEDSGADKIPNTKAGKDGVLGTADDDLLEGDGVFTIQKYTEADLAHGLIPPGKNVGDPIPGTGEDIDGDGVYDPQITLSDIDITVPLNPSHWGGNMPAGGHAKYKDIATMKADTLEAVFYTNHSFCWVVTGSGPARINGALVSRNENIIYGTPAMVCNYDSRLLGGNTSLAAGLLPTSMLPAQVLRWVQLDRDPNRFLPNP
ncbi:MAG TPA: hypothetical protein VMS76_02380 [Planctomycetota bacterium]|nr:hypothetical protein [Planctomycetota bacterium]